MVSRVKLKALTAALAGSAVLAVAASPAQAAQSTCDSLQTGLDNAMDGATLTVAAGTCSDHSYTLPSHPAGFTVTVEGAGTGTTFDAGSAAGTRIMTGANVGTIVLRNLTFTHSTSTGDGGAVSLTGNSSLTLDHTTFLGNSTATGSGGAVSVSSTSTTPIAITDSAFGDGSAAGGNSARFGGALSVIPGGPTGPSIDVNRSTFDRNTASTVDGGVQLFARSATGHLVLRGSRFSGNVAPFAGGADLGGTVPMTIEGNLFRANRVESGTGTEGIGGGLALEPDSGGVPAAQNDNVFDGNSIVAGSPSNFAALGGGEAVRGAALTSRNDRFTNNSLPAPSGSGKESEGAGLAIEGCETGGPFADRLENVVAAGNQIAGDGHGAGVYAGGCGTGAVNLTILDSTISGNQTSGAGATAGLLGGPDDTLLLRNSIVAGNIGGADVTGFSSSSVTSSDACAPGPFPGAGNICAAPFLVHPGPGFGDAHETQFSPTIDHGTNADVPPSLAVDFEGDQRIVGPAVDMGADEFTAPSVVTGTAKQRRRSSANLTGTVVPNTHATSYRFEYGDTTDYGKSTKSVALPAGTSLVPVSLPVTGLRPKHLYHYRLVATNSAGTTYGLDRGFNTTADTWSGVRVASQTVTVRKGVAAIRVSCPKGPSGACAGTLTLKQGKKLALGKKAFKIKAGRTTRVKVRISKKGRRSLSRRGTLHARASVNALDALGTKKKTGGNVKLKARRQRH